MSGSKARLPPGELSKMNPKSVINYACKCNTISV